MGTAEAEPMPGVWVPNPCCGPEGARGSRRVVSYFWGSPGWLIRELSLHEIWGMLFFWFNGNIGWHQPCSLLKLLDCNLYRLILYSCALSILSWVIHFIFIHFFISYGMVCSNQYQPNPLFLFHFLMTLWNGLRFDANFHFSFSWVPCSLSTSLFLIIFLM